MHLTLNHLAFFAVFCMQNAFSSLIVAAHEPENIVWFPNPNNSSGAIPGFLTPSPSPRIEFNESFIHFYLYTKQNPSRRQEIFINDAESLRRSYLIPGALLKFMTHGFGDSEQGSFPQDTKDEYLKLEEDINIITMDWSALAESPYYFEAVINTKTAGRWGAQFIEFLIREEVATREKLHIFGYSLGGHVAGIVGSNLISKAARLTGIDPAKPLFENADDADRIDPTDAEFVDVIHTAGLTQGLVQPRGHVDFYPNGGAIQPGCGTDITGSCSHARAPACFAESVANPLGFRAHLCQSWEDYQNNLCTDTEIAFMGQNASNSSTSGKYFLRTNSEAPLAQG